MLSFAAADTAPAPKQSTIPIRHVFRDKPLEFHKANLTVVDGTELEITRLEYLISNVRLQRADGTWISFPDQYFHINAGEAQETMTIAGLDANDSFRAMTFTVGLDEKTNHGDPAKWPAGHALNPLENNLNWDWKGGYVFLAVEGRIHPVNPQRPAFLYHVGSDKNRIDVECSLENPTAAGSLSLAFRVDELWDGPAHVSLTQDSTFTHSRDGDDLAPKLAKNAKGAFTMSAIKGEAKK